MKRGLKGVLLGVILPISPSSNHCPDEKGTESGVPRSRRFSWRVVATIAPMKRGLKETIDTAITAEIGDQVATIAPMKRGLKVNTRVIPPELVEVATIAPMKRGLKEIIK